MDVAAEDDRVPDLPVGDEAEELFARRGVAVPAVGPEADLARRVLLLQLGHHHLLRQDVPARLAPREAAAEPALLLRAQHRPLGREALAAVGDDVAAAGLALAAGLVAAILPPVEDLRLGEVAEDEAAVEA